jgi:hypothetical protein
MDASLLELSDVRYPAEARVQDHAEETGGLHEGNRMVCKVQARLSHIAGTMKVDCYGFRWGEGEAVFGAPLAQGINRDL